MGNKRIYLSESTTSKYAKLIGIPILTVTSIFLALLAVGFNISGTDDFCLGTPDDPCISYGKICNPTPDNYDIYNAEEIALDFSPTIENYWMFFKDGRVKKQMLYDLGINASTSGWRYENFTNVTKPRSDRLYVHRFGAYSCQEYMLVGLKDNPDDLIKWGIGVSDEYLDPFWYGENESEANISVSNSINLELGSKINISTNLTGAETVCVDIDHPDYGDNYICGSPSANFIFNISYFRKTEFNDSSTSKELDYPTAKNQTIYIQGHQYDEVINLTINLTGESVSGDYPENVRIYVNDTLDQVVGPLRPVGTSIELNQTNSSSLPEFVLLNSNGTATRYIAIPDGSNVSSAYFNYSGYGYYSSQACSSTAGFCWNASGNLTDCNDVDNCANLENAYDSNVSSYSHWETTGTSSITSYLYLNYTHDITYPSFVYWKAKWRATAGSVLGTAQRMTYFECYDYLNNDWSTLLTRQCIDGAPYSWCDGTTQVTEIMSIADTASTMCLMSDPIQLRIRSTHSGTNADANSDVYIYEVDTNFETSFNHPNSTGVSWFNLSNGTYGPTPNNVTIEVGQVDGSFEGNYTGNLPHISLGSQQTTDFAYEINTYLETCTIEDGYCNVPIYSTFYYTSGRLRISDLNITYIYNPNPIQIGLDLVRDFLNSSLNFANIPITIYSDSGNITVDDVKYDYAGGNDTIEVLTFEYSVINNSVENPDSWSNSSGFQATHLPDYMEDQNYTTYARCNTGPTTCYVYENYTINDTITSGYLNVTEKDSSTTLGGIECWNGSAYYEFHESGGGAAYTTKSITEAIPSECFIDDNLQIRYKMWTSVTTSGYYIIYDSIFFYPLEVYNRTNNETFNIINYFSDWDFSFPNYVDYLEFIPNSPTSKNVTPYGQTSSIPIFNFTTHNYGGKNMNLSIKLNTTNQYVNLTFNSTGGSKPGSGNILNTTWVDFGTSLEYLNNTNIWLWADYGFPSPQLNWTWWFPDMYIRACCEDCICSEDLI